MCTIFFFFDRPEGVLEPDVVAEMIVDGVLRNKPEVYTPPRYSRVDFSKA